MEGEKTVVFVSIGKFIIVITTVTYQDLFFDSCVDPGNAEDFYPLLRNLEERWMVQLGSLGALDPVQGCNKKDDAKAKARTRGN